MTDLKISFNRYDYFGLILPGVLLLTSVLFIIPQEVYIGLGNSLESYKDLKFAFIFLIGIILIFISYLIGMIISSIGSWLIEGYIIKKKLKYPSYNLFNDSDSKWFESYKKSYSSTFIEQFNKIYNEYYNGISFQGDDKFIVCFTYVKEKCPITYSRLNIFLSMYGQYRNLTVCFLIICSFYTIYFIFTINLFILIIILLSSGFSIVCFYRFLKFFRIYSDEIFRTFYMHRYDILKSLNINESNK
ncbi:MAG: hypothetical protein ACTSRP_13660 [Candidatus Helarchaeota archaeon]